MTLNRNIFKKLSILGIVFGATAAFSQSAMTLPTKSTFSIKVKYIDNLVAYSCDELIASDSSWALKMGDWEEEECTFENLYTVDVNHLPFKAVAGDYSIHVSKEGQIVLKYSYGDADFVAVTKVNFPNLTSLVGTGSVPEFDLTLESSDNSTFAVSATAKIQL